MKETIRKCDRCKITANQLIDIQMVNQNVDLEQKQEENSNPYAKMMFGYGTFGTPAPTHPTIIKEVCIDCAQQFCRWVDHSENLLTIGKPVCVLLESTQ